MKAVFLLIIKFYKYFISPLLPNACRYYPSCSQYAKDAINQKGAVKGSFLAINRILRCHPFAKGGYDPLPNKEGKND